MVDNGENVLAKVLRHAGLHGRGDIGAGVVEVAVAHDGNVEARQVAILDKLAKVRIGKDEAGGENVVGEDGAKGVGHLCVRFHKRHRRCLKQQLGSRCAARFQVHHAPHRRHGGVVLRRVEVRGILQRLFAVVEEENDTVAEARAWGGGEDAEDLELDGNAHPVVGAGKKRTQVSKGGQCKGQHSRSGAGQGRVEVGIEKDRMLLSRLCAVGDADNDVGHAVVLFPHHRRHEVEPGRGRCEYMG